MGSGRRWVKDPILVAFLVRFLLSYNGEAGRCGVAVSGCIIMVEKPSLLKPL